LPPISDEEKPFELPDGWEWVKLGNILHDIKYGLLKNNIIFQVIPF
jgi:type I restriction enzyme S subunit